MSNYPDFHIGMLKTGYFMVYQTGGWFGKLIEKHQLKGGASKERAKYTHIDVLGPRQWVISVNPPHAKVKDVRESQGGRKAVMLRFKADDYDTKRQYVSWWAVSNNNKAYDWWGIVKFKIGWMWHKKNLFFCSENASWALLKEYPKALGDKKPHEIFPAHFFDFCEVVWEGTIPNV